MSRYTLVLSLVAGYVAALPLAVRAQDADIAGRLYAEGVQAYFAGRSADADAYLSRSIAAHPSDPRSYYFRALSRLRQGRPADARTDMQTGADLEARLPYRFDIGKTLERVQGPARLTLERYRDASRLKSAMHPPAGPLKRPDTAVLRERRVVPLDEFLQPGVPRSIVVPDTPPIATTPATPPAKALESPAAAPAAASPFDDDTTAEPAAKTPPGETSPAAAPPARASAPIPPQATPPQPAPPASEPAKDDDNPFL